jgi:L-alanine-DL-glutamate epimerase-like enolase superfamily enzyme
MDDTPAVVTTITHLPRPVITGVRVAVVSVPLPRPVSWSNVSVSSREYVLVWVDADDGQTGFGFTLGSRFGNGGAYIASAITDLLEPLLIGRVAFDIERLWEDMAFQTLLLGRRGAVMRAISAVDIALWDLLAISAGRPLCDLLGRYRSTRVEAITTLKILRPTLPSSKKRFVVTWTSDFKQ